MRSEAHTNAKVYVVSVSGGLSSAEALERAITAKGLKNVRAVFADVGEAFDDFGNRICGEDEDLFRFLGETQRFLGIEVTRLRSERYKNIWDVFFGERMLGSTLRDPCSRWLKRRVIDEWIRAHFVEFNTVRCLGFSWLEESRAHEFDKLSGYWQTWHPLLDPPYLTNEEIAQKWESRGIKRPRLYAQGYAHNNCGGFCVKMGLGQARDLLILNRAAYLWHEEQEQRFRREISADATIFKRGKKPITMRDLRIAFEAGYVPKTDKQICGGRCMIPTEDERGDAASDYFWRDQAAKRAALEAA